MRITIFTLVILPFSFVAQTKNTTLSSFDIYYGCRPLFQNFYKQLNTINDLKFGKPLQTIGVGSSGHFLVNRGSDFYGHWIYNQILPQTIFIQDSIKGKLSGFVFSFAYGASIISKNFVFMFYSGFNTGRLRMFGNELIRQKNPFFSPKIGIQPKIKLGKIALTLIIESEYDISKPRWRRTSLANENKSNLDALKQSGITAQLGVGYLIKQFKTSMPVIPAGNQ